MIKHFRRIEVGFSMIMFLVIALFLTGCLGGGGSVKPYEVAGEVKDGEGSGIENVKIKVTGGKTLDTTTNEDGVYEFVGLTGTCTLTPEKEGYTFNPSSRLVTKVNTGVDFEGTQEPLFVDLALVPGALEFPIYTFDDGICSDVNYPYYMAKYQVTYGLWREVYEWATSDARGDRQYSFQNQGVEGNDGAPEKTNQHPVTTINWRDAVVWCNALTEYYNVRNGSNLDCVYTYGGQIVRDSTDDNSSVCDNVAAEETAKGFRLPTIMEWELAARYIGESEPTIEPLKSEAILMSGIYWTPGVYPSGATADRDNEEATKAVSWYHPVGEKNPSALNLYDMNGNVDEWCFDGGSHNREVRGGGWSSGSYGLYLASSATNHPYNLNDDVGFRVVRSE